MPACRHILPGLAVSRLQIKRFFQQPRSVAHCMTIPQQVQLISCQQQARPTIAQLIQKLRAELQQHWLPSWAPHQRCPCRLPGTCMIPILNALIEKRVALRPASAQRRLIRHLNPWLSPISSCRQLGLSPLVTWRPRLRRMPPVRCVLRHPSCAACLASAASCHCRGWSNLPGCDQVPCSQKAAPKLTRMRSSTWAMVPQRINVQRRLCTGWGLLRLQEQTRVISLLPCRVALTHSRYAPKANDFTIQG